MLVLTTAAFSQCITFLSSSGFSVGPDNTYTLTIYYTSTNAKSIHTAIYCKTDIQKQDCSKINCNSSGTKVFSGITCGNLQDLRADITAYTNDECEESSCASKTISGPTGGPLPVKLTSFSAVRSKQVVALNWNTEFEIDSKEFIIQRAEGIEFRSVGTIASINNSSTRKSYSFNDKNENAGTTYYRLKNVDLNGSFTYSEIRTVKGIGAVNDITVFPNPARSNSKISVVGVSANSFIQLLDFSGKILKNINSNTINSIDLTGIKNGTYLIRIVDKATNETVNKTLTVSN